MKRMHYYIFTIVVILIIFVFAIFSKNSKDVKPNKIEVVQAEVKSDVPIDFGYKTAWISVRTNQKNRLAEIMNLKNYQKANWEMGLELAYEDGIFVTPQIGEWTIITGWGMNMGGSKEEILELEETLNALSAEFEEAHFFGTHRVVEFQSWMKSVNGKMIRAYTYVGEQGETIRVLGEPTKAEEGIKLFDTLSEEAKSEDYFEREDLTYADEILVMEIAEKWSINPTKLSERTDIKDELGLAGK